ncbi:trypsin-like serine protease with C-terminal PDZ domain [Mycolicibacterium chubuense NBB4]|uniref:Trypsin-like serine protease with C-terminal PDZ domain n=1 Tax=Mycolicibacterium chubuense (strain NBB4) TaxID=710421 RepID=I4BRI3_MYCCN|nr:S1C family serine protease [Mycolicibacterium chubuense]AFM19890.1 trypsin-like serine protease with C-terminal PDZ domain [Mycolicibacterium chubuense NBB4]
MPSPTPVIAALALTIASLVAVPTASAEPVPVADTTAVEPGVVRIDTDLPVQGAVGSGTGVVLRPDGIALTNNHVIRGAADITATDVGTGRSYPVDVVGYDRKNDVAVLRLRGASNLPVAPTADSSTVRIGDPVTGVGFPGGGPLTRSPGTVRALGQNVTADDDFTGSSEQLDGLIGFDADTLPGDSGGPLVDSTGRVVGIVTVGSQTYRMTNAGGFAIPINQALATAEAIQAGNASGSVHVGPTGILGIGINDDRDPAGVVVQGVLRGSPADLAGLAGGDVITGIDAVPTPDGTVLTDVLDRHHPGDPVTVDYLDRARTAHSIPVRLAAGPPN